VSSLLDAKVTSPQFDGAKWAANYQTTVVEPAQAAAEAAQQLLAAQTVQQSSQAFSASSAGCGAYSALFEQYDWDVRVAEAICMAESGGHSNATNYNYDGSIDRGLMQINSCHGNTDAWYDPATNIAEAFRLYQDSGWKPWTTYTSGAYLRYLSN